MCITPFQRTLFPLSVSSSTHLTFPPMILVQTLYEIGTLISQPLVSPLNPGHVQFVASWEDKSLKVRTKEKYKFRQKIGFLQLLTSSCTNSIQPDDLMLNHYISHCCQTLFHGVTQFYICSFIYVCLGDLRNALLSTIT